MKQDELLTKFFQSLAPSIQHPEQRKWAFQVLADTLQNNVFSTPTLQYGGAPGQQNTTYGDGVELYTILFLRYIHLLNSPTAEAFAKITSLVASEYIGKSGYCWIEHEVTQRNAEDSLFTLLLAIRQEFQKANRTQEIPSGLNTFIDNLYRKNQLIPAYDGKPMKFLLSSLGFNSVQLQMLFPMAYNQNMNGIYSFPPLKIPETTREQLATFGTVAIRAVMPTSTREAFDSNHAHISNGGVWPPRIVSRTMGGKAMLHISTKPQDRYAESSFQYTISEVNCVLKYIQVGYHAEGQTSTSMSISNNSHNDVVFETNASDAQLILIPSGQGGHFIFQLPTAKYWTYSQVSMTVSGGASVPLTLSSQRALATEFVLEAIPSMKSQISSLTKILPTPGTIANNVTVSSFWPLEKDHNASRCALNFKPDGSSGINYGAGAWCAGKTNVSEMNQLEHATVDAQIPSRLIHVITQGRADGAQWVTKYKISFSHDNYNFYDIGEFPGNFDNNSQHQNAVSTNIRARYWRISILGFYGHPSLRFGFVMSNDSY